MRSVVHNSDFTNRRKAFRRIWGEFSCSRILDEFGWSPHNFRFQAFEVASASNAIKAHFSIRSRHRATTATLPQRAEGLPSPGDIHRARPPLFRTISHNNVNSQPTNPSYAQPETRSGVISTQTWTDIPIIHSIPQRDTAATRGHLFWFCVLFYYFFEAKVQYLSVAWSWYQPPNFTLPVLARLRYVHHTITPIGSDFWFVRIVTTLAWLTTDYGLFEVHLIYFVYKIANGKDHPPNFDRKSV